MIISKEDQEQMIGMTYEQLGMHIITNSDLNICDTCEKVAWSNDLNWFEDVNKTEQLYWEQHLNGDALCDDCYKD